MNKRISAPQRTTATPLAITIFRTVIGPDATDGILQIGGQNVCSCSEHTATRLSAGTYAVLIHRCHQYQRKMPIIVPLDQSHPLSEPSTDQPCESSSVHSCESSGVRSSASPYQPACASCPSLPFVSLNSRLPHRCPMIKPGNGVHNRIDGSIIVGERLIPGVLIQPAPIFARLVERLVKAHSRGKTILLTIRE